MRNIGLLALRLALGVVFIAHGWQKLSTNGIDATIDTFKAADVPMPEAAAWFAALVELIGGGALILGVMTPLVGLLLTVDMAGAFWFVHRDKGLFVTDGGWEFVVVLAAASLALGLVGAGRFSVDGMFFARRNKDDNDNHEPAGTAGLVT